MIRGIIFPTQDGVSARHHGACNLGEMGVHRGGVDERQHQTGGGAAARADRAKQIGPFVSGISWRTGSAAARRPDPGERALLAYSGVRRENRPPDGFLVRLTPGTRFQEVCSWQPRGSRPLPSRGTLFEKGLGFRVGLRVLRAHRETTIAEHRQILAHRALVLLHAKLLRDPPLKVLPPPAHDPVPRRIGTRLHPARKIGNLVRVEPSRPGGNLPVRKTRQAAGVVAMDPLGGKTVPRKVS